MVAAHWLPPWASPRASECEFLVCEICLVKHRKTIQVKRKTAVVFLLNQFLRTCMLFSCQKLLWGAAFKSCGHLLTSN